MCGGGRGICSVVCIERGDVFHPTDLPHSVSTPMPNEGFCLKFVRRHMLGSPRRSLVARFKARRERTPGCRRLGEGGASLHAAHTCVCVCVSVDHGRKQV